MRNLKKFLALVLAMVMTFSLMLTASAATNGKSDFNDSDKVSDEYVEAVAILAGLNVIKGDGDEEKKDFRPQSDITRAEAAALVYRMATGDIEDKQVGLYSDYSNFTDVKRRSATDEGDWFAGYVGYCQNAGIIKGTTPTTFNPYGKVTGYEVLAMILRAVGYGKNNEFTGSSWQVNVASLGKTKHITDSVTSDKYGYTLNQPARREIVAELLFRGSMIPQVTWTQLSGYNEYNDAAQDIISGGGNTTILKNQNASLAWEVFRLNRDGWEFGAWGRPQLKWTASLNPTGSRTVALLDAKPSEKSFHDLKRECEVADLLGIKDSDTYRLFVNDDAPVTTAYKIVATDTVTKVGGQGRLTEIYLQEEMDKQYPYYNYRSYWSTNDGNVAPTDTIVMIDTYLAKVVSTTNAVLDAAGHVITPARMIVDLYDRDQNMALRRTISKASGDAENWTFSAGDVLSMNAKCVTAETLDEAWAFTMPTVEEPSGGILVNGTHVSAITKLEGRQAQQTTVYFNQDKHQVDGKEETDALTLRMDKAGTTLNTTFTWYFDTYGNILGIDDGRPVNFGVITSVYVAYGAETNTDGVAKAIATVKYANGKVDTETIDYFMVQGDGSATPTANDTTNNYDVMTSTQNTLQVFPYYSQGTSEPMTELMGVPYNSGADSSSLCAKRALIYMAPVAANNSLSAVNNNASYNKFGILNNNLFKFVRTTEDKTVAIEVAGGGTTYTASSLNTGDFAGNWAATATNAGSDPKIFKTLSYISKNGGTTNADIVAWLDDDTQIMVRDRDTGIITCYNGVSDLPGDVTIDTTTNASISKNRNYDEIDWADTDNDGRADVVYVTGKVNGVTAYGLFYYNYGTAQWNGTSGTASGWLNGESKTLTFTSESEFNAVKNSGNYKGHLFAVKMISGVVVDVLATANGNDLVFDYATNSNLSGNKLATFKTTITNGSAFEYGVSTPTVAADPIYLGNNPYSANTEAVYYQDVPTPGSGAHMVQYNFTNNWNALGATVTATDNTGNVKTYHLTPTSKIYGLGAGNVIATDEVALEYLNHSVTNDVTIVYENANGNDASMSILEIYIQTDPNITPTTSVLASVPSMDASLTDALTSGGVKLPTAAPVNPTAVLRDNYVKNNLANGVYKSAYDMSANQDAYDPANNIYFKFETATEKAVKLSIWNAAGTKVYEETMGADFSTNGGHYFYVCLSNGSVNAGTTKWVGQLPTGVYTYAIEPVTVGQNIVTGGTGTFTVN